MTLEVTKTVRDEDGELWTASTADVDRQGDRIDQAKWDLAAYKSNPILLFGHNYNDAAAVIGRAVDVVADGRSLKIRPEWRKPATPNDPMHIIRGLIDDGLLRALSVGFRPLDEPKRNSFGGVDFGRVELYEISLIPVPANAAATRQALEGVVKGLVHDPDATPEDVDRLIETMGALAAALLESDLPAPLLRAVADTLDAIGESYGV